MKKSATFLTRNNVGNILCEPKSGNLGKICNRLILTLLALCAVRRIEARSCVACRADFLFWCEYGDGPTILGRRENSKAERQEKTSWPEENHRRKPYLQEIQYPGRGLSLCFRSQLLVSPYRQLGYQTRPTTREESPFRPWFAGRSGEV